MRNSVTKFLIITDGTLIAGVAQHVEFEIFYGTRRSIIENSVLQLACPDRSDIEFWVLLDCKIITLKVSNFA